jgi:hypothetical protein
MKRPTLSLVTLLCISAASLTVSISRDRAEPEGPEVAPAVRKTFAATVQKQVLAHINPAVSPREHLSRVMRPVPMSSFASRIVAATGDDVLLFEIVHTDRSRLRQVAGDAVTTTVAQGRFESKTLTLQLWDEDKNRYVPATKHPLVAGTKAVF